MSGFLLLIPFLLIRFGLLSLMDQCRVKHCIDGTDGWKLSMLWKVCKS